MGFKHEVIETVTSMLRKENEVLRKENEALKRKQNSNKSNSK